jgi:hypothetical protein
MTQRDLGNKLFCFCVSSFLVGLDKSCVFSLGVSFVCAEFQFVQRWRKERNRRTKNQIDKIK